MLHMYAHITECRALITPHKFEAYLRISSCKDNETSHSDRQYVIIGNIVVALEQ